MRDLIEKMSKILNSDNTLKMAPDPGTPEGVFMPRGGAVAPVYEPPKTRKWSRKKR